MASAAHFLFYGGVGLSNYFGTRLRKHRIRLGLTQQQVAEKINVDRSTYSYYELGRTTPSIETLYELTKLFGVSADELIKKDEMYN